MVSADGVADVGFLLEFLGNLGSVEGVRHFRLLVGHFTDVVEQASALGFLGVETQFRSHHGAEVGSFACMLQQVLAIAGAIFHLTDDADELGVQAMNAEVDGGAFTRLDDFVFKLFLHFGHHFFDACGVNASVGYELVQGQSAHFTADGVEG